MYRLARVLLTCAVLGVFLIPAASDARWSQIESKHPARWGQGFVYIDDTATYLMFGGRDFSQVYDTLLEFDRDVLFWTDLTPMSGPAARFDHVMVYDQNNGVVLVYGGQDDSQTFGDTWAYDLATGTWSDMAPSTSPPARFGAAATYDEKRHKMVLFGGNDGTNSYYNDLWEYDYATNTWTEISTSFVPDARYYHNLGYDPNGEYILLAGGTNRQVVFNDFLEYHPTDANGDMNGIWVDADPTFSNYQPRFRAAMIYDRPRQSFVILGGEGGGLVFKEGAIYSPNFGTVGPYSSGSISPRVGHGMVYDESRTDIVISGGLYNQQSTVYPDLWGRTFLGFLVDWARIPGNSPAGRTEAAITQSLQTNDIYMFGGRVLDPATGEATFVSDAFWVYSQTEETWFPIESMTGPTGVYGAQLHFDEFNQRVHLWGGTAAGDTPSQEFWYYDIATETWNEVTDPGAPMNPGSAIGGVDQSTGELLLLVWDQAGSTWVFARYDAASGWTTTNVSGGPSGRRDFVGGYEIGRDIFVLHGGIEEITGDTMRDTWILDRTSLTWRSRASMTAPSRRVGAAAFFEGSADQLIHFGGEILDANGTTVLLADTHAFHPLLPDLWQDVSQIINPEPRKGAAMNVSYNNTSALLFGGAGTVDESELYFDLWQFTPRRPPVFNTPTPLVTPTPDITPTPSPTPTQGGSDAPPFILGGFLSSDLEAGVPGTVTIAGFLFQTSGMDATFNELIVELNGVDLGLRLTTTDGVYFELPLQGLNFADPGQLQLELRGTGDYQGSRVITDTWPYLNVEP